MLCELVADAAGNNDVALLAPVNPSTLAIRSAYVSSDSGSGNCRAATHRRCSWVHAELGLG
jgi:hypothetical protein